MIPTLRRATNHAGFNVERLTATGWAAVTGLPFAHREAAESYLAGLDAAEYGELRVYEALHQRRVVPDREALRWPLRAA